MKTLIGMQYRPADNSYIKDLATKLKSSLAAWGRFDVTQRSFTITADPYLDYQYKKGDWEYDKGYMFNNKKIEFVNVKDELTDKEYRVMYYPCWVVEG